MMRRLAASELLYCQQIAEVALSQSGTWIVFPECLQLLRDVVDSRQPLLQAGPELLLALPTVLFLPHHRAQDVKWSRAR